MISVSRPYDLGAASVRKHNIPISAIPCYSYRYRLGCSLLTHRNICMDYGRRFRYLSVVFELTRDREYIYSTRGLKNGGGRGDQPSSGAGEKFTKNNKQGYKNNKRVKNIVSDIPRR